MQEKKNQGLNITCLLHMCYILDTLNIYVLLQKKKTLSASINYYFQNL